MSTIIRNNPLRQRLTRIVRYVEFSQPQIGNNPITATTQIPGLPNNLDTALEIVNELQDLAGQNNQALAQFQENFNNAFNS